MLVRQPTCVLSVLFGLAMVSASAHAGDAEAGKAKSAACAACHGPDGNSPAPTFPIIAGQYEDYMLQALKDYKTGARNNAIMTAQVAALSETDMADLAAYFASQTGLKTIEVSYDFDVK